MADFITRCPKCATAFRISQALLESAKGMVRCGSCLSVFNAKLHLETIPAKSATQSNAARPAAADDTKANQPQRQGSETHSSGGALTRSPKGFPPHTGSTNLFEREVAYQQGAETADHDEIEDDEAWALELLKDDDEPTVKLKKVLSKGHDPEPKQAGENEVDEHELVDIDTISEVKIDKDPEQSPPQSFLEADLPPLESESKSATNKVAQPDHSANARVEKTKTHSEPTERVDEQAADDSVGLDIPAPERPKEISEERQKAIEKYTTGSQVEPPSLHDVIAGIEPEPLEVEWQTDKTHWLRRLMWPILAVVALTALLVQVAWLEFNRLNRTEPYRSMYGVACAVIGCELPELIDRSLIKTSKLLVRSHPDVENALMVDVIIQNNADFKQAFPALLLTFTDLKNRPVADRKLLPDEYLGGELSGVDKMPIKQPIHISLEIVDPGSNAVSYSIAIVD